MSTLEIILSVALAIAVLLLVRLYRKQLILRHIFYASSDWCARKIDRMAESAVWAITDLLREDARANGRSITEKDALGVVPIEILNAKAEWVQQKEAFQARLARNGIRMLTVDDLDNLILNPGLAGLRP